MKKVVPSVKENYIVNLTARNISAVQHVIIGMIKVRPLIDTVINLPRNLKHRIRIYLANVS